MMRLASSYSDDFDHGVPGQSAAVANASSSSTTKLAKSAKSKTKASSSSLVSKTKKSKLTSRTQSKSSLRSSKTAAAASTKHARQTSFDILERDRVSQLENLVAEKERAIAKLTDENKTLVAMQKRQEKALRTLDREQGDLPHVIDSLRFELRQLKQQNAKLLERLHNEERTTRDSHAELVTAREKFRRLKTDYDALEGSVHEMVKDRQCQSLNALDNTGRMSAASTVPSERGAMLSPSPMPLPPQRMPPHSEAPSKPIVLHVAQVPRRITTRVARTVASVAQEKREAKVRVVEPVPIVKSQQHQQPQVKVGGKKVEEKQKLRADEQGGKDGPKELVQSDERAADEEHGPMPAHKSPVVSNLPTAVDMPSSPSNLAQHAPPPTKTQEPTVPAPAPAPQLPAEPTPPAAPAPAHTIFKPSFGGPRRPAVDSSFAPPSTSQIKSSPSQVVEITSELPSSPSPKSTTFVPTLFSSKPDLSSPVTSKPPFTIFTSPAPAAAHATKPTPTSPGRPIFLSNVNPTGMDASPQPTVLASSRTSLPSTSLPFLAPSSPTTSSPPRSSAALDTSPLASQRATAVSPSALPSVFSFGVTASVTAATATGTKPPVALFDSAPAAVSVTATSGAASGGGYLPSFGEPAAAGGARAGRRQGMAFQ